MKIFGPMRDEMTGGWRKLHNEELNRFNSTPRIIRLIKSRKTRWPVRIERIERRGKHINYCWKSIKKMEH
jgi:hypothetical protein